MSSEKKWPIWIRDSYLDRRGNWVTQDWREQIELTSRETLIFSSCSYPNLRAIITDIRAPKGY